MGKKSRRKGQPKAARMPFVARTFEGLPHEGDWIALREFVPSADGVIRLADGTDVRFLSSLPGNGAGLRRPDGEIWVGLQVRHNFGDISRDLAHVVELARDLEPGTPVTMTDPGVGPRLQDLVADDATFDVVVRDGFDHWLTEEADDEATRAALAQANESIAPTVRLGSVESAYWTEVGDHRWVRWIQPHPEDELLDALARLQAADDDRLGDARMIGSFRAHGLLVPVWETEHEAEALEEPATALQQRLEEALAATGDLTAEERNARNSIQHRQLTIR